MKKLLLVFLFVTIGFSHPVSYTIDLAVSYDEDSKTAKIDCSSNSKNKCGLYSIRLLDKNDKQIVDKRFPFLKKSTNIKSDIKPSKLEFYLRKTPEHLYVKIFD